MKRFLKFCLVLAFLFLVGIISLKIFLPSFLKKAIETHGNQVTGSGIRVGEVEIARILPLTIRLGQIVVDSSIYSGTVGDALVGLGTKVSVKINQLSLVLKTPKTTEATAENKSPNKSQPSLPTPPDWLRPIGLSVELNNSQVVLPDSKVECREINLVLKSSSLALQEPLNLFLTAKIKVLEGLVIPVEVNSKLKFKGENLEMDSRISVLSLTSQVRGYINVITREMDLVTDLGIANLEKIPLAADMPVKKWSGSLEYKGRVYRKDSSHEPSIEGKFSVQNVKVETDVRAKNLEVLGPALISASGSFKSSGRFKPSESIKSSGSLESSASSKYFDQIVIDHLNWNINLSDVHLRYGSLLNKPAKVVMWSQGDLNLKERLNLKTFMAQFDRLVLEANGLFSFAGGSDFNFHLKPTNLKGMEKYFVPLMDYPMEGFVEARGKVQGDLRRPETANIQIDNILAKNVRGKIKYHSAKLTVQGGVALDLNGKLTAQGKKVSSGQANAFVDLTELEVVWPRTFSKKAGQVLKIDVAIGSSQNQLTIQKAHIKSFFGPLEITGQPPFNLSDPVALRLKSAGINFKFLGEAVPVLTKWVSGGDLKFDLGIEGKILTENFWQSPLKITGDINPWIEEINLFSGPNPTDPKLKSPKEATKEIKAFLPDGQLLKGLKIIVRSKVRKFSMDGLTLKNILINGNVVNQFLLLSDSEIGSLFGGSIKIKSSNIPLTLDNPYIPFDLSFKGLDLGQLTQFITPQWKDLASGQISGTAKVKTFLPQAPRFQEAFFSQGHFELRQGHLNTIHFTNLVKEKLSQIPGAENIHLDRGPLQANAEGDFLLEKKVLRLAQFHAVTVRNEEINLDGQLGMDMSVDMRGVVRLVDWPGGGDFYEANKDERGRIVVPINVVGNALQPELSFAGETIKEMLRKLAEYELQRKRKNLEDQFKNELEKKLKEFLKK